jgi:cellulose synthase/poly-beta-1,6-N-acetylglucosamine synthase-like glycosyltransferase
LTIAISIVVAIAIFIAKLVFALYLYDVLVSLAGFFPLPRPTGGSRRTRFAVIICAHNESNVVAHIVKNVRDQDYPPENLRVYVVADNCSDNTADVARAAGAIVLERRDEKNRTKGYALQWGMDRIIEAGPFDALCVFDADNLAPRDFLSTMDDYLASGHKAIQAYLDTKNPTDSLVTRCIALAYHVTNRFWMRARARLGLSTTLGGTGVCLDREVVLKYRWDPGSLADDLELTMKLIRDKILVSYCYHTRTYDEKPTSLRTSLRQRTRWMQGHNDVALRWIWPMLKATVTRPSIRCFDAVLHLLQPLRILLAFSALALLLVLRLIFPNEPELHQMMHFTMPAWAIATAMFVVYPLIVCASEGVLGFALTTLLPFMLFAFTWIPAVFVGLLRHKTRVWIHTSHGSPSSGRALETVNAPDRST